MKSIVLAVFLASALDAGQGAAVRMIAHRGGVVDARHVENTLAALEEAVQQGYWMVEIDVRRSKDGELYLQHDDTFMRCYGVKRKAADLGWDEIRLLRTRVGDQSPCTLAEYAAKCRGRIRVMVDTKETGAQGGFFEKMEEILRANDLLKDALFIGSGEMKAYFKGKARVGTDRDGLRKAVDAGEDVASLYFLFVQGNEMDGDTVKYAQSLNVPVVPTVNDFHYLVKHGNATPQADVKRLREEGATLFQIDSFYAEYCK